MSLFDHLVRLLLPLAPRFLVGRVARRYIAGPSLDDAVRVVRELNDEGATATVDFLGEEVREPRHVDAVVEEYSRLLAAIREQRLECHVSLKPTAFGLRIDEGLCREAVGRVAEEAASGATFVRLDMEDHTATEATLRLYEALQPRFGNLGVVLQAMLRRTLADVGRLLPRRANVRLCKGIYREPREHAWPGAETIRANYIQALEQLLDGGCTVGIATHDEHLIWAGTALVDRLGLGRERYEFQMLLGVEPELRQILLGQGRPLRVYVPYGSDWYGYAVRRLRENPTIARHVLRALFRRRRAGEED